MTAAVGDEQLAMTMGQFEAYAALMDDLNQRWELVRNRSREITKESKHVVYLVHRATIEDPAPMLEQAESKLVLIRGKIGLLVHDLIQSERELHLFHSSFSPGLQEYVEAESFSYYLSHSALISKAEIQTRLDSAHLGGPIRLELGTSDYLLGIADLSGEVMRRSIYCGARGQIVEINAHCQFMRKLLAQCELLDLHWNRDWDSKMTVMRQSTKKVEASLFKLYLQRMEFDDLLPMKLSADDFRDDPAP